MIRMGKLVYFFSDYPEMISLVDLELSGISADSLLELPKSSKTILWWKCGDDESHRFPAMVNFGEKVRSGSCQVCSGKHVQIGANDLQSKMPELVAEMWSFSRNTLRPTEITSKSRAQVWWECNKCKQAFQSTVYNQTRKPKACPICAGKRVIAGVNDVLSQHPEVARNLVSGHEDLTRVSAGAHKVFTWQCPVSSVQYSRRLRVQIAANFKCPHCVRIAGAKHMAKSRKKYIRKSQLEREIGIFIADLVSDELVLNSWTKKFGDQAPFEIDILVKELSIAIEVNGDYWHSDEMAIKLGYESAKARHLAKVDRLKADGIDLIFIWESDWRVREKEVKEALKIFLSKGQRSPILDQLSPPCPC